MELYPPGQNPAISLYAIWDMLIRPRIQVSGVTGPDKYAQEVLHGSMGPIRPYWYLRTPWARERWTIEHVGNDHTGNPVYGFGRGVDYGRWLPSMYLRSNGNFRLNVQTWGQRHALEAGTFLANSYLFQRYYWYVPRSPQERGYWKDLANAAAPHATAEWVLRHGYWLALAPDLQDLQGLPGRVNVEAGRWRIVAAECDDSRYTGYEGMGRAHQAQKAMTLQDKQWHLAQRRLEMRRRRKLGLPTLRPLSAPPARLRSGNQTLTSDDSVAKLAALIQVDATAKQSLHARPIEAQEEIR